jgi:hypothetical protein
MKQQGKEPNSALAMSQDISWRNADFVRNTSLHLRTDYDEAIGLPTTAPAKFCVQIGLLISLGVAASPAGHADYRRTAESFV